ncbi:hypothetical protein [Streptomyces sp. NPDC101455]|uniref:hypothetical protein n=1 Tax=Streptomyces sp. NPDC101455 TaxID=3366142 RepID=UPI00380F65CE
MRSLLSQARTGRAKATWYLATDLPRPGSARAVELPGPPADLAEIVRIYGLRHWIEQSYKQVKDELGWADFQVRSDTAIRRDQTPRQHCFLLPLGHLVRSAPARRLVVRLRPLIRERGNQSHSRLGRPAGPGLFGPSVAG